MALVLEAGPWSFSGEQGSRFHGLRIELGTTSADDGWMRSGGLGKKVGARRAGTGGRGGAEVHQTSPSWLDRQQPHSFPDALEGYGNALGIGYVNRAMWLTRSKSAPALLLP